MPRSSRHFEQISVFITIETTQSRFATKGIVSGKFKSTPDESNFNNAAMSLGGAKSVSIVEPISTSTDSKLKSTRALLDAVIPGGTYGKDPNNKEDIRPHLRSHDPPAGVDGGGPCTSRRAKVMFRHMAGESDLARWIGRTGQPAQPPQGTTKADGVTTAQRNATAREILWIERDAGRQ